MNSYISKISGSSLIVILGFSISIGFLFRSHEKYKDLIPKKCTSEFIQLSKSSKDVIDSNKFNEKQFLLLNKMALDEYEKCIKDYVSSK